MSNSEYTEKVTVSALEISWSLHLYVCYVKIKTRCCKFKACTHVNTELCISKVTWQPLCSMNYACF